MIIPRPSSPLLLALLGAVASTLACVIPDVPLSNNITEKFSIFVQNASQPLIHNRVMNFRANGDDEHLVLRPKGTPTYDVLYLENGLLHYAGIHAVIDLEYNDADNTTKMFMTARTYHPTAVFQPVYDCDPDTDELQIRLELVARLTDPPVYGGQIGIRDAVGTYEFRYSPPENPLINSEFMPINMVIFHDGQAPNVTTTATPTSTTAPATTPSTIGDYEFVSCWAEPDGGRTLPTVYRDNAMTNELCAADCGGSEYIGTQWSIECWCGSTLADGSAAAPAADCSNTCGGDPTEICGGGRRLSLYRLKSASSSVTVTTTTSSPSSTSSSSSTDSSFPSSTDSSSSSSTDSSSPSSTDSSFPTSTDSSSPSSTDSSSSSSTDSSSPSTTSSSSTSTPPPATTSTTASATPTTTVSLPAVGNYNFVSCYSEPPDSRALPAALLSASDMTLAKCASFCSSYPYFGTEWSRECWCDNALTAGSAPAPLSECNYPCSGDATETCGGSRRLSLYHNDAWVGPQQPATVGSYGFYNCLADSQAQRTLSQSLLRSSAMTLEMCASFCSGYKFFGAEWSVECWCGNALPAGVAIVAGSECSMTCGGDSGELCGNADRLSVYLLEPL